MRLNPRVLEMVRHFAEEEKPIAALCHGPQILVAAGVLNGYTCAAYPAVSPDVEMAGGTSPDIKVNEAYADRNLVSGPAWPAHPAWLSKFLDVLGTEITL